MSKTFTLLIDDYIKFLKFHKLEILPQMISKKEQKQKKQSLILENLQKKEKIIFNYGEVQCMESQKNIKELIIQGQNLIKLNKNFYQNLSNLTSLDLSNNNISKISKKINQFPNLKRIILNNNFISVIPFYLSELLYLEELQLEDNLLQLIPINIQNFPSLKILHINNNKLEKIPVELGLIKNLEILLFEKNQFTEIPTSLCYLKKLKRIKLEWFEYVHSNIDIDLKDINIIQSFKLMLKERLLQSKIYIDFQTFIAKFSQDKFLDESINTFETEKTECYNILNFDIFHALNNNYIGVIKSFIKENPDIILTKNKNGKTPLYLAIQQNKKGIYEYLLEKVDLKKMDDISYTILFKAIRMRNFPLVVKLNSLGISLDKVDEKGNNVFHILFSVFINNYDQCIQIGNFFIEKGVNNYNNKNKDGWAPIHIAAKHANYICLEWIGYINEILEKKNKKKIDINIPGKKNWTALHLVISSYKYSEFIKLIELGCNVFLKNSDGKSPRFITNNFFLSKMLYIKEYELFNNKYINNNTEININNISITNNNYYSYKSINKLNSLNYEKRTQELILNNDKKNNNNDLMELYKLLMILSLNDNKDEVQSKCKEILNKIDLKKNYNNIIISDILGIIYKYNLTKMILDLKKLLNNIESNSINNKNIFLKREFINTIKYLEQVKNGKINIITKINIYINVNNNADEVINNNNIKNININNKRGLKKSIILKKPGMASEKRGFKKGGDEVNFNKSMRNKLLNNTSNKKMNNPNNINKILNTGKKFSSDMKKLQEKHIQESINSVDFELDDTIKNS